MAGIIRGVRATDATAIQRIYEPFVTDRVTSFEAVAPDVAEIGRRLLSHDAYHPWLVFEEHRHVLGYAYASPHGSRHAYQWSVNVSVYIDPSAHRRGIGRALYGALFDLLRRQRYANAYAGITIPNPGSERLHTSLGFSPVGVYRGVGFKFGAWHDVLWLHLRLRDVTVPEGDPLAVAEAWTEAGVAAMLTAADGVAPGATETTAV